MGSWYDVLGRRKQVNQCLKIEPGRHRHTEESDPHRMDNRSARRACFAFFNFPGKIFRKQLTIRESAGIITPVVRHGTNIWGISSAGSPAGIKTHPQSDSPATIKFPTKELHPRGSLLGFYGGLAQLGERLHGMQEVSGSIPLFSTKKALYFV